MALFSVIIILDPFYRLAGIILGFLTFTGALAFGFKVPRLLVNSRRGNTPENLLKALITVVAVGVASLGIGFILGFTPGSIVSFLVNNRAAVVGSQVSIFAGNPIVNFFVFAIAFPVTETVVVIQAFDWVLQNLKIPIGSINPMKNPRLHLVAISIAIVMIFYHIFAKTTVAGIPNPNVLIIIFLIFYAEMLVAAQSKEAEPAIFHHIINNALALL